MTTLVGPVADHSGPSWPWYLAYALSVAVHVLALFGVPPLDLGWIAPAPARPIEARIVQAPPPPQVVPAPEPPATPKARPAPRPKPRPKPVPPAPISLPDPSPPQPAIVERVEPIPNQDVAQVPADERPSDTPVVAAPKAEPSAQSEVTAAHASPIAAPPAPTTEQPPSRYPLKSARMVYDLSYGENPMRVGRVTHLWTNDGERYFAETTVEASGIFALIYGGQYVQRSWGGFGPSGLVPTEYFVQRGRPDRGETAQFDWEAKQVAFNWRSERRSAALIAGTQDPISMLHQIFYMQPLPQSKTLNVASSRKFGAYLFQFLGEERVETPMGEITALHVRRKDDDADHVDVWVDPQRSFLPVRVHYVDRRGYVFDQRIREIELQPVEK